MLAQLPRLTSSLRERFDIDQAYLRRKTILQALIKLCSSGTRLEESDLARRMVHQWKELLQKCDKHTSSLLELIDREVPSDEFREVAFAAYRLFGHPVEEDSDINDNKIIAENKLELQNFVGHAVSDANVKNVASLARALYYIQPTHQLETYVDEVDGGAEFGADLVFNLPARFLVEESFGERVFQDVESNDTRASFYEGWSDVSDTTKNQSARKFDLSWLRDSCGQMVSENNSQLSRDELAMAICRFLDSDKPGEEIAGDLLDLVGDSACETVQELIMHRKEIVDAIHHDQMILKSDKTASNTQSRMPTYGTQIFGRAGRPQFDKSGEGIIITSHDKLAYYLRLLTSQLPIESQFISSLKDNLNAEVVLGTVTNVNEACAWLGYTYLSIRMKLNPLAYGVGWDEIIADPFLTLKQRALVADAARSLDTAKMMRFDEKSGNFYCIELGRVASHFYIQYFIVETYNELLKRHINESEIIDMVAHSSEFENIVVIRKPLSIDWSC